MYVRYPKRTLCWQPNRHKWLQKRKQGPKKFRPNPILAPHDDIHPWWPTLSLSVAKHCQKVGRKTKSEAWNQPKSECKRMTEGPRNMLGVFINLLYICKMLINYYSSKPTSLRCRLMAKHCLKVGRKSRFFPDLRHETRLHVAVKVWWMDLQSCWECSSTCFHYIYPMRNHQYIRRRVMHAFVLWPYTLAGY